MTDAFEEGARTAVVVTVDQIVVSTLPVQRRLAWQQLLKRRHFRGEIELPAFSGVEKWFDPEGIAYASQSAGLPIQHDEGKHPGQPLKASTAPLRPNEAVPQALQLCSQFPVVVNLTVENDRQALVGRQHRLMPGRRQIQDRQSGMAQGNH
jgi:hypothetical protein